MRKALLATLALFAVVLVLALVRYGPPAPAARDAAPDLFSAERAKDVLRELVATGPSRRIGSEANARARALLARHLEALGFTVEIQRSTACSAHGTCGYVQNVVAHREGSVKEASGILLAAHFDSVPASPGASDDGLGTAALIEVARALGAGRRTKRPLVLLFSDGEEAGLLGAEAFAREHPLAKTVKAAINVDARGSSGPSALFETSDDGAWLVYLAAQHLPRPVTSSLYYEVYRRMPNDTDFTVLRRLASGVNFANTARIEHYHTRLDTLETSDPGTLQHHGENVLAMARALDVVDIDAPPPGAAVWFDVLSFWVPRWPASWNLTIAGFVLAFVVVQAVRMYAWGWGLVTGLAQITAAAIAATGIGALLGAGGGTSAPWFQTLLSAALSLHLAALAASTLVAIFASRTARPRSVWAGTWVLWAGIGLGAAVEAPGASYLFTVPAFAAAFFAPLPYRIACAAPSVIAAVVWMPLLVPLYDALGFFAPALLAAPTIVLATTLAPMLVGESWKLPLPLAGLALVLAVTAMALPPFSAEHPQRVNVAHQQDDEGARVLLDTSWGPASFGRAPLPMRNALGSSVHTGEARLFPSSLPALSANAVRLDVPPPEATVVATRDNGTRRHVRVRLRSPRGASTLRVAFPEGALVDVTHEGQKAALASSSLTLLAVPEGGTEIDIAAPMGPPLEATVYDLSYDLPTVGLASEVAAARPAAATPSQDGDVTVVSTRVRL
jgi:hypothetical protein